MPGNILSESAVGAHFLIQIREYVLTSDPTIIIIVIFIYK